MTYRIAPVDGADAEPVRELMARVIRERVTQEPDLLAATLDNVNRNCGYAIEHPGECVHLKATLDGELVGVILIKHHWNLCSLFVAPAHHGRGIGRSLVEAGARLCDGRSPRKALLLNAARDAIAFYERLGFVPRESAQELPPGYLAMQRPL